MGHVVATNGGLKTTPPLLKIMATPQVPGEIIKRLPINVSFFVNIERSDSINSASN
jgi:hypothetical protein